MRACSIGSETMPFNSIQKRFKTVSHLSGLEQFGLGRDLDVLFVEIEKECSRFDHIDFNNVEGLLDEVDERLENDPKYNTGEHAASGKLYRSAMKYCRGTLRRLRKTNHLTPHTLIDVVVSI